jgi:thiamine-phosphate pyrophosphorylase
MSRPACGLYLVTPVGLARGDLALPDFGRACAAVLDAVPVDALLLRIGGVEGSVADDAVKAQIALLLPLAHQRGVPLVIEGRADLAAGEGCDGVHLPADRRAIQSVRRALGDDAIVGAAAGQSRHAGMEAGEAGADYAAFGLFDPAPEPPAEDLLEWWQEMMELPCVALGGVTLQNAAALAAAGADFLALRNAVWNHPQGPAKAAKLMWKALKEG